jgi:hypothetical protein
MRINSKLAWGAAWAGLIVVVAVPSADFLTGRQTVAPAVITSDTDPAQTAAVPAVAPETTPTAVVQVVDPDTGIAKPLSSLTSTATAPAAAPMLSASDTTVVPDTKVAAIDPIQVTAPAPAVAPMPAPASLRPHLPALPKVTSTGVSSTSTTSSATATSTTTNVGPPLIIDETKIGQPSVPPPPEQAAAGGPVPPANIGDDTAEWEQNESLSGYLKRQGLLDEGSGTQSQALADPSSDYDPDGFYLSDGPNSPNAAPPKYRRWFWSPEDGFNLF